MGPKSRCRWAAPLLMLAGACGPPKEAEDPRDLLGDELEAAPREPADPGEPVDQPTSDRGGSRHTPLDPPATRAECEAAAKRMVELGLRAAAADPDGAGSVADLSTSDQQKIVDQAVNECLSWKTPRSEAKCVARAQEEHDIDHCVAR